MTAVIDCDNRPVAVADPAPTGKWSAIQELAEQEQTIISDRPGRCTFHVHTYMRFQLNSHLPGARGLLYSRLWRESEAPLTNNNNGEEREPESSDYRLFAAARNTRSHQSLLLTVWDAFPVRERPAEFSAVCIWGPRGPIKSVLQHSNRTICSKPQNCTSNSRSLRLGVHQNANRAHRSSFRFNSAQDRHLRIVTVISISAVYVRLAFDSKACPALSCSALPW